MGASNPATGFFKYPRTFHLWGSQIASGDKMLSEAETRKVLSQSDSIYVWESKLDGTNLGISCIGESQLMLQNRGHILGTGEHPQYDLLRPWSAIVAVDLASVLGDRYVMYGEWMVAKHTIHYPKLKHYFNEFDIWDKSENCFLSTELRNVACEDLVRRGIIAQVPVVHVGQLSLESARKLMSHAPIYGEDRPEGLYLKIEKDGKVTGRYKLVHDHFVQSIIDADIHWKYSAMVPNGLAEGVNILRPSF